MLTGFSNCCRSHIPHEMDMKRYFPKHDKLHSPKWACNAKAKFPKLILERNFSHVYVYRHSWLQVAAVIWNVFTVGFQVTKLTMQAVQSLTRPDTVGYRWCHMASTVTKVAADASECSVDSIVQCRTYN